MKLTIYLSAIAVLFVLLACTEDPYSAEPQAVPAFKFQLTGNDSIRSKFAINKKYLLKLRLINEYLEYDSVSVSAIYKSATTAFDTIKFYNDGGLNGSPDQIPNNEIWTAYFTSTIDNDSNTILDSLIFTAKLYTGFSLKTINYRKNINCIESFPPVIRSITGITNGSVLQSGFAPFNIFIKADDENNINNYTDNLRAFVMLYDSLDALKRTDTLSNYIYDSLKFNFRIDSSYAAGVHTSAKFRIRSIIEDSYGDLSDTLKVQYFKMINTKPEISKFLIPDSVIIPAIDSIFFYVKIKCKDRQSCLKDMQEVRLTLKDSAQAVVDTYFMLDDGNFNESGDSTPYDDIYTKAFKLKPNNHPNYYIFDMIAIDKAGNQSTNLVDTIRFVNANKKQFKGKK